MLKPVRKLATFIEREKANLSLELLNCRPTWNVNSHDWTSLVYSRLKLKTISKPIPMHFQKYYFSCTWRPIGSSVWKRATQSITSMPNSRYPSGFLHLALSLLCQDNLTAVSVLTIKHLFTLILYLSYWGSFHFPINFPNQPSLFYYLPSQQWQFIMAK